MRRTRNMIALILAALVASSAEQALTQEVIVASSEILSVDTLDINSLIDSVEETPTLESEQQTVENSLSGSRQDTLENPELASVEGDMVTVSVEAETANDEIERVVETLHGRVQGYLVNGVHRYIDIPYGNITDIFQAPTEPESWEGVLDETEHEKRCPQMLDDGSVVGELDCLTISVFTPPAATGAAVLFHIHDGGFKTGSGDPGLYGPDHLVNKGVIVVLPNYRLGPLGFLCLDSKIIPGNAALKDLSLALKWTSENIALFGGDPNSIVVSGIGMAGALVGYLALSPVSSGYISKAIASSGSVLAHWAIDRSPQVTALELAHIIAGVTANTSALHETDWRELTVGSKNLTFGPCVESDPDGFIIQSPWAIIHEGEFNKTFMLGTASHAGLHDALECPYDPENDDLQLPLPDDLYFKDNDKYRSQAIDKLKMQYFQEDNEDDDSQSLILYHTDASYLSPSIRAARCLVAAGAAVYFYEFSYLGELNIESQVLPEQHGAGAAMGDIVGYVFAQEHTTPSVGDQYMVALITDLWANFIKTGVPSAEGVMWHKLEATEEANETWLSIGGVVEPRAGVHVQRLVLWTEIYDQYFVDNNVATSNTFSLYSVGVLPMISLAYKMFSKS